MSLLSHVLSENTKTFSSRWTCGEAFESSDIERSDLYIFVNGTAPDFVTEFARELDARPGLETKVCCFLEHSIDADGSMQAYRAISDVEFQNTYFAPFTRGARAIRCNGLNHYPRLVTPALQPKQLLPSHVNASMQEVAIIFICHILQLPKLCTSRTWSEVQTMSHFDGSLA